MPEKKTLTRAAAAKRAGKAPTTQAGEFVREEIEHLREGRHVARSTKQAIAIGLSKARRAGVDLPPPEKDKSPDATRKKAERDLAAGSGDRKAPSPKRSLAASGALERASRSAAAPQALAGQAEAAAQQRSAADRSRAARKAAATKGAEGRSAAARKAAQTRAHKQHE